MKENLQCFESCSIDDAISTWNRGGLVAIPTETVYGLAAPINDLELIKKIFIYKERPLYDPLIVHVGSIDQARSCVKEWPSLAERLAKKFWPGPLTIVLAKNDSVNSLITSGLETVGLRCPRNQKTLQLLERFGVPLAAPSANKFTKTSPTKKEHVLDSFKDHDLCVLTSSEDCEVGIESTIIRIESENEVTILRPGMITDEDLRDFDPSLKVSTGVTAREMKEKVTAPGQDKIHYRPSYPLFYAFGLPSSIQEETHIVELESDPTIAARFLYLEMQKPLGSEYKARLFILPKDWESFEGRKKSGWESLLNRLEKAAKILK